MPRILTITNGHGEDLMASLLAERLMNLSNDSGDSPIEVTGYPLVGQGDAYGRRGIPIAGVQRTMPSGGFIWKGATNLIGDLRAGLVGLALSQYRDLKSRRGQYDWAIALGDIYCLWLAGRMLRRPAVFVPTAKSEYISGHYGFEYRMMRRYAAKVFPRDEATAATMRERDIPAEFVGNLMMDALDVEGLDFFASDGGTNTSGPVVALLPGSREEAYENAFDLARVVARLPENVRFLLALAPSLDAGRLAERLTGHPGDGGWRLTSEGRVAALERDGRRILVVQGHFGDVLSSADIVVGLSGTGNEQAVGMGKPLVSFPGRGAQFTRRFAADQRKLLGDSVSLVERDPEVVASEVLSILNDEERYARMAAEGRRRMGPPGALSRMARAIGRLIGSSGRPV